MNRSLEWVQRMPQELDDSRREFGRFLILLNVSALVPSIAYFGTLLVSYPDATGRHLAMLAAITLQVTTTALVRKGYVYSTATFHIAIFCALVLRSLYEGGGLEGVSTTSLLVLIVILSFVPYRWAALIGTAFACATLVGLYVLQRSGLIPPASMAHPRLETLLGYRLTVAVVIGIFATLGAHGLRRARDFARRQKEQLAERASRQEGLASLGERALSMRDLTALRAEAVAMVVERLRVDRAAILVSEEDGWRRVEGRGWTAVAPETVESIGEPNELSRAAATETVVRVDDFDSDAGCSRSPLAGEDGSALVAPIGSPRPRGLLAVYAAEPERFSADHASFAASVAHVLASAQAWAESDESRRQSEAQLRHAQKLEAIGRLASGIAHDFNNLLTVVLAQTAILRAKSPEDHHPGLDAIHDAGANAAALTRQLLALGRKQVLHPTVLDVNEAIGGVGRLLERLLGESYSLTVERAPEPLHVRADPTQMQQVLINLALNARDAMPRGGEITVRTCRSDTRPDMVAIEIEDRGEGMNRDVMARVLEPFFTTKEGGRGMGLGLAVVDGIVQQSGGRITCESEPGEGSLFRVELPEVIGEVPAAPLPRPSTRRERGWRLLLAEDEPQVRHALRRMLEHWGCEVTEASSGEDATSIFEALSPSDAAKIDALVTDVVMPGMGGVALAKRLRELRPDLPVLFISGHPLDAFDDMELERSRYLQKPCLPDALDAALAELLEPEGGPVSDPAP